MHWGPSQPSHLTRLLHVSDDPVEGHFRAHVACVVDRLPAGFQWKAHLCQLHYCRLIYFWSWKWDKHGINNCTVAAADSTQPGACRWKLNKILLQVPLIEGDLSGTGWCGKLQCVAAAAPAQVSRVLIYASQNAFSMSIIYGEQFIRGVMKEEILTVDGAHGVIWKRKRIFQWCK